MANLVCMYFQIVISHAGWFCPTHLSITLPFSPKPFLPLSILTLNASLPPQVHLAHLHSEKMTQHIATERVHLLINQSRHLPLDLQTGLIHRKLGMCSKRHKSLRLWQDTNTALARLVPARFDVSAHSPAVQLSRAALFVQRGCAVLAYRVYST